MSKCDDLLAAGEVTQDPNDAESVIVTTTLSVKKVAIDSNGLEMFASDIDYYVPNVEKWTPTIVDGDGNTVANPIPAIEACRTAIKKFVNNSFASIIDKEAAKQVEAARLQIQAAADAQKAALMG